MSPPVMAQKRSMRMTPNDDMDIDMADITPLSPATPVQRAVQLPRQLRRPKFRDISKEALEAVDSELKDVALDYILEKIQSAGAQ